jgi:hypothetical protein
MGLAPESSSPSGPKKNGRRAGAILVRGPRLSVLIMHEFSEAFGSAMVFLPSPGAS